MSRLLKSKAPFILAVALAFFVYQLIILVNSFPADYRIAIRDLDQFSRSGSIMPLFHLGSELTGEVGVILRFAGACLFLAFVVTILWKKTASWKLLRRAVLLEGIYYLFNIPFIIYLFVRTNTSIATYGAAISYTLQLLLVTPIFIMLYLKLRNKNTEVLEVAKWAALAVTGFIFALWVKHFALAVYALPFSLNDTVLVVGFVNSALTLLVAGALMIIAFLPVLKKKSVVFNAKLFGAALILMGIYVIIFVSIAWVRTDYLSWINLIDWWIVAMPILGAILLLKD
jgi:hypothetical protein